MPRSRLHPTLADYMAIAISPALIMLLVGSLAFFLLHVFYAGEFASRLHWITGCFVFAAVLISRVSIEEGAERASLFGLALGVAVALAMIRFVDHPWWAWLVLAIIWWCASHLVWNCTLVDDDQDASGEGLLEAAGLDAALSTQPAAPKSRTRFSGRDAARRAGTQESRATNRNRDAPQPPAPAPQPLWRRLFNWWQGQRRRTAPPGLWVVYFSLAALPIFGIGQIFIPAADRAYAFRMACQYVGSGLGLLLTTSFLGLRRYLRQRNLEMPLEMAGAWLGVGGAMAVAILIVAAFVPRPNPEYAISSLSGTLGSPSRQATSYSPMRSDPGQGQSPSQAPANDQTNIRQDEPAGGGSAPSPGRSRPGSPDSGTTTGTGQPPGAAQAGGSGQAGSSGQQGSGQPPSGAQAGDAKAGGSATSGADSESRQQAQGQGPQNQPTDTPQGPRDKTAQQDDRSQGSKANAQNPPSAPQPGARPGPRTPAQGGSRSSQPQSSQPSSGQSDTKQQSSQPRFKMPSFSPGSWLLPILKVLLYLGVLYCLWRFWPEISAWLARLWQEFLALWSSLFGGRRAAAAQAQEAGAAQERPRPFASFNDPFVSGEARRHPANTIVWYSFEALEAWAAERELGRHAEETPLEFAARLAEERPALAADVRDLASLYARVAYARETLSHEHLEGVERLWGEMRRAAEQFAPA